MFGLCLSNLVLSCHDTRLFGMQARGNINGKHVNLIHQVPQTVVVFGAEKPTYLFAKMSGMWVNSSAVLITYQSSLVNLQLWDANVLAEFKKDVAFQKYNKVVSECFSVNTDNH